MVCEHRRSCWRVFGEAWVTEVLEEGDHWCARVVALNGNDPSLVAEALKPLGVEASQTPYAISTVDFPPTVDAEEALRILDEGFRAGLWDYSLGVAPG